MLDGKFKMLSLCGSFETVNWANWSQEVAEKVE